jgi:hypothetical protein
LTRVDPSPLDQHGLDASELASQFQIATAQAGAVLERTYRIGGNNLRLRYAGPALLERLSPSIEHLRSESDGESEHLVEIWDAASTGTQPPPAPPGSEQLPPAGIATSVGENRRAIYQAGVRTLSLTDTSLDRSWYWAADADLIPEWEASTPLRHILHLWLASRGIQFVHAGAVGRADGGFIIVGKSGSGKSSSTLSTLGSRLLYAGDDYVGVSLDPDSGPYVHSLYGCGKLETAHVARFPGLRISAQQEKAGSLPARRDKTIFYVRDTYPEQVTTGFPLKAIIVPRISPGDTTRLSEIELTTALKALIPSTMFEIHAAGQSALTALTQIARHTRTLELRLGADMTSIPALLEEALSGS